MNLLALATAGMLTGASLQPIAEATDGHLVLLRIPAPEVVPQAQPGGQFYGSFIRGKDWRRIKNQDDKDLLTLCGVFLERIQL